MTALPQPKELPTAAGLPTAAMVLWTLGQLLLLAAIWTDFRLSANPAHTAGQFGLPLLLAGQLVLSTILFADLTRTLRLTAVAFAVSFPLTQLVGWSCSSGAATSLLSSAVLALWLIALLCWMHTTRSERTRHLLAALLLLWVLGTPLLWYALAEFAPGAGSTIQTLISAASPLLLLGVPPHLLLLATIHAALAAGCAAIAHWRQKQP